MSWCHGPRFLTKWDADNAVHDVGHMPTPRCSEGKQQWLTREHSFRQRQMKCTTLVAKVCLLLFGSLVKCNQFQCTKLARVRSVWGASMGNTLPVEARPGSSLRSLTCLVNHFCDHHCDHDHCRYLLLYSMISLTWHGPTPCQQYSIQLQFISLLYHWTFIPLLFWVPKIVAQWG